MEANPLNPFRDPANPFRASGSSPPPPVAPSGIMQNARVFDGGINPHLFNPQEAGPSNLTNPFAAKVAPPALPPASHSGT